MFEHQRHKPPRPLERPRDLVVACAPMRSNVNLSRIVRACGCSGVPRMICCGPAKIDQRIARDGAESVEIQLRRTLQPVLKELRDSGFRLVGLEQTTGSANLYDYRFQRRTVLVVGNERHGLADEILQILDDVIEIPVYGLPYSHNAATAAAIAIYEYCRQFPDG